MIGFVSKGFNIPAFLVSVSGFIGSGASFVLFFRRSLSVRFPSAFHFLVLHDGVPVVDRGQQLVQVLASLPVRSSELEGFDPGRRH